MSALTILFTNLANKIRSKTGKSGTLTPAQMINEIDEVYSKGVGDSKVGNAEAGDVTASKTFTNSSTSGVTGTMPDYRAVTSPTVQNGNSDTTKPAFRLNGDNFEICPMAGRWGYSYDHCIKVPAQAKTATPGTSAQAITPDAGKALKSVTVEAISPQKTNGSNVTSATRDANGPYVTFPYGWYPNGGSGSANVRLTEAQAIGMVSSQSKTVTASRQNQTVTPDSGKLLSQVTVNKYPDANGTFTVNSRSANIDMGATNNYRYVNTSSVPNNNTGRYTLAQNETSVKDLGADNNYRYIDATNVYNKGKLDVNGTVLFSSFNQLGNDHSQVNHSYSFTAPSNGIVVFYGCATGQNGNVAGSTTCSLSVNGTNQSLNYPINDYWQVNCNCVKRVNSGDSIYARVIKNQTGGNSLISAGMYLVFIS